MMNSSAGTASVAPAAGGAATAPRVGTGSALAATSLPVWMLAVGAAVEGVEAEHAAQQAAVALEQEDLAEGRAPSEALQSVFSKFKVWIQAVYKFLTRLDVQLTDEVRGIMDRMLASEEEIAAANARAAAAPLAADQAAASALGMDDAQFADYRALVEKA